jgi:60 kDa SS-A/Ro ribonucleoprotein
MRDPLAAVNTRATDQRVQADPIQVANNAGGFVFEVSAETRLRRFLTLGSTGGTYYVGERELTKDNADVVLDFARNRGADLLNQILAISEGGRAPKQNPCLFALAAAAGLGDVGTRRAALAYLPRVARTGTALFQFVTYAQQFRGWGPTMKRGVQNWYLGKDQNQLAYQLIKYRQREGWTHRDVLRKAHPKTTGPLNDLFSLVTHADLAGTPDIPIVIAYRDAQRATTAREWRKIIDRNAGLSWEMLPDAALNERDVWEALLDHGVPQTALMRQLPRLTKLGVFDPGSIYTTKVISQLTDPERLAKARVHPVNVLIAQRTYASGHSARGTGTWTPNQQISDALDKAFYAAYGSIPVSNKRFLLALDISGSMGFEISGLPITCREASAAIALVTMATEQDTTIVGFTSGNNRANFYNSAKLTPLNISPRQRLDDAIRAVSNLPFGGTDCSLPAVWAKENGHDFDAIVILTDNETWAGKIQPYQALTQYRNAVGHDVKQIVVAMTPTEFTIADPRDPSSLDVAGFDSATPGLISDFAAGLI